MRLPRWLRRLTHTRTYGAKSITAKGEEVKSIAERRIADYFERNNINYVYEQSPVYYSNFKARTQIAVPDFYLPDYGVYVEYWGLVNADDYWEREQYVQKMKQKMAIYHKNNIKFIFVDTVDQVFDLALDSTKKASTKSKKRKKKR